jgi:hypothetical protein
MHFHTALERKYYLFLKGVIPWKCFIANFAPSIQEVVPFGCSLKNHVFHPKINFEGKRFKILIRIHTLDLFPVRHADRFILFVKWVWLFTQFLLIISMPFCGRVFYVGHYRHLVCSTVAERCASAKDGGIRYWNQTIAVPTSAASVCSNWNIRLQMDNDQEEHSENYTYT